jgi:integrase
MSRKPSRTEWKLRNGKWTRSLGQRGQRVMLFQKRSGGVFYRRLWIPGEGYDRKSIGTTDKGEAEKQGKALLASLLRDEQVASSCALPLSLLWDRYRVDCVAYQGYTARMKKETAARVQILIAYFGEDFSVRGLTEQDQLAFTAKRRVGGNVSRKNKIGKDKLTMAVRPRSVQADLEVLRSMLHWATTFRVRSSARLLDRNPLDGVALPGRGTNPRRPAATHQRYTTTRTAILQLQNETESESERVKWLKLELALVLAHATGRRLGSIRQLAWADIDFAANMIHWRAGSDKVRKDWRVPMPDALREELQAFRVRMGAPSADFSSRPSKTARFRSVGTSSASGSCRPRGKRVCLSSMARCGTAIEERGPRRERRYPLQMWRQRADGRTSGPCSGVISSRTR